MLDIMHAQGGKLPKGILHCYSGSWECAKEYLKMGFYLSIAGPVTFKKAPIQWEVAQNVPLDRLLVETDSPYLAPEPMRGHRNEPAFVRYVAEKIASLRNISFEELAEATTQNAKDIYRIE
jgi:TatD DNase family protein